VSLSLPSDLLLHQMNGAGNRILVLDLRTSGWSPDGAFARELHARPGLAFDQLMTLEPPRSPDLAAYVRILNNDGSEAQACGNGTRCVADVLMRDRIEGALLVETVAGRIACERIDAQRYRVDMGAPALDWRAIPVASEVRDSARVSLSPPPGTPPLGFAALVNMGNPHVVFFVADLDSIDVARVGRAYELHPLFPEKANVSFAQVRSRSSIRLKVWERGVGETLACGSAACATLVSAVRRGLTERTAAIELPGGELGVEWRATDGHVILSGPVEYERTLLVSAPA
jgi:diaminopimelate epimerase